MVVGWESLIFQFSSVSPDRRPHDKTTHTTQSRKPKAVWQAAPGRGSLPQGTLTAGATRGRQMWRLKVTVKVSATGRAAEGAGRVS